jgi:hypothetical protein|tara:strand:+ start:1778 stop:2599 length:822 start_codon:yes stop_codon:yes gene_type:complete
MSEEQAATEDQAIQDTTVLGSDSPSDNLDWKASLSSELANDPTITQFKDVESLAKTVVHQQKQMGSRIPIPKTDEEYKELYGKLGRPDDPTGYETKIPEGMEAYFNENAVNDFKNIAHEIGLNQNQVSALMDYQSRSMQQELDTQPAMLSAQKEQTEKELKSEWGVEYDRNIRAAQRALQVYGDPEILELMNTTAGNNPAVVKLFARLGAEVTEDMTQNTQNNNLAVSRLDAQDEISQVFSNNNHPYFQPTHPEHLAAVERVRQLHEKVHGGK